MANTIVCSFARAAVKVFTIKLQSVKDGDGKVIRVEPRHLTEPELRRRHQDFAETFSFSPQQVKAHLQVSIFSSLTYQEFNKACKRILEIYHRNWPGGIQTKRVWLAIFSPEK